MNTDAFVNRYNIRMSADWADTNPNIDALDWAQGTSHYRCTLRLHRKQMTTYFSQGPAISRKPSAADVLDCLASDACGLENARNFEDWCAEYGYDSDSRKAERIYNTVQRQSDRLKHFLNHGAADLYDKLVYQTERL